MDGILETPGRILIMTTNRASVLDPALIRPGRIDMIVHFQRCSPEEVNEIYQGITGSDIPEDIRGMIPDKKFSPAKVTQKIFEYHDDPEKGIRELIADE
jgi:SpoVK/Ycf46/Vps4 family AAA+-type ATPase